VLESWTGDGLELRDNAMRDNATRKRRAYGKEQCDAIEKETERIFVQGAGMEEDTRKYEMICMTASSWPAARDVGWLGVVGHTACPA
jgi:hypothetical protein